MEIVSLTPVRRGVEHCHDKALVIVAHKHPEAIETQKMKLFAVHLNLDDIPMTQVDIAVPM